MKKIIVPYVTENNNLYYEEFDDEDAALQFIEQTEDKCLMITIRSLDTCDFETRIDDHT